MLKIESLKILLIHHATSYIIHTEEVDNFCFTIHFIVIGYAKYDCFNVLKCLLFLPLKNRNI